MPSSPLQHLLKLLQAVSEQRSGGNSSDLLNNQHPINAPSLHSYGDGVRFLEKFRKRPSGPIASSTPQSSPTKMQGAYNAAIHPDRKYISLPDLNKLSPIRDRIDEGNATGPTGASVAKKLRFK